MPIYKKNNQVRGVQIAYFQYASKISKNARLARYQINPFILS